MFSAILTFVWILLKIIGCYFMALWRRIVPCKPKDISGKLVLVTGGRRGIGRALALEFAKHGANIVLWDIDQEETNQTAEDIRRAAGVKVMSYECDVTDNSKVKATAAQIRRDMGKVDILVNNAGIANYGPFLDKDDDMFVRTLHVNVLSHFWTLKTFLPDMLDKKEGHILAVCSVGGIIGVANSLEYCTSKFAVRGMCDSLEQELRLNYRNADINVSVLCPSFVQTDMTRQLKGKLKLREGEVVSTEYVAREAVNGVLRNQRIIFAPPSWSNLQYISMLLPRKAFDIFLDAISPAEE